MKRNSNYETEYYNYSLQLYRRKIIILCCLEELPNQSAKKKPKRWYVRPIFQERPIYGQYSILQKEHQLCNSFLYFNYMRMDSTCFEELITLVGPKLERSFTRPDCLSVGEILSATIRYLASGQSMTDITYAFRVGLATVSKFIFKCCSVLWEVLAPKMLPIPTQRDWEKIALEFKQKWNFGNCIGAIDGKHCVHQAFPNSGLVNYNYKGLHSTVLLAVCDANYKFIMVDIGAPGRCSDGGIFKDSLIGKGLLNNTLQLPCPTKLSSSTNLFPYCLVGNEAFPLLPNLMRPYPSRGKFKLPLKQVIFNYRLNRARRTIENAFGLLAAKWRILRRQIIAGEKTVHVIIQATVVLHNYVISNEQMTGTENYCQSVHNNKLLNTRKERRDNQASGLLPVLQMGSNNPSKEGKYIREKFTNYFSGEGGLEFQYNII